jgi:centractin
VRLRSCLILRLLTGISRCVTDRDRLDCPDRFGLALYSNIALGGGSTLTKGLGDRLISKVRKLAVKDTEIKMFTLPERKDST